MRHPRKAELRYATTRDLRLVIIWAGSHLHHSKYQDAVLEEFRPVSRETSSALWDPRCFDLRWSGHLRLRHPRSSGFRDALPNGGPATFA